MPPPAAADAAAAGLLLAVDPPRATVTLRPPTNGDGGGLDDHDTWLALAAIGRGLPGSVRVAVIRGIFASPGSLAVRSSAKQGDGIGEVAGSSAVADVPPESFERSLAAVQEGVRWLGRPDLVSVAAVSGPAVGPGAQLALACDLRVVADDASFAWPEVAAGTVPFVGGATGLVAAVGYARALEICVTGRTVGAPEAVHLGLANLAVPADDLDAAVDDLVAGVLTAPRAAATELKALLLEARRADHQHENGLIAAREAAARCLVDQE